MKRDCKIWKASWKIKVVLFGSPDLNFDAPGFSKVLPEPVLGRGHEGGKMGRQRVGKEGEEKRGRRRGEEGEKRGRRRGEGGEEGEKKGRRGGKEGEKKGRRGKEKPSPAKVPKGPALLIVRRRWMGERLRAVQKILN